MNYELLPYPAIESLFWHLPIEICVILHDKYNFAPKLWREKIIKCYGVQPERLIFKQLLTKDEILACIYAEIDINDKNGWTVLHFASSNGDKNVVQLLINIGVDINAKNDCGWTALHYASIHEKKEIVELLIDNGAEINAKNNNGDTALHYASIRGKKEIVELLIERGAEINAKDS